MHQSGARPAEAKKSPPRWSDTLTSDPLPVFVKGRPALLLTSGEKAWITTVNGAGVNGLSAPRLRFVVDSWLRGGNRFDLDNLVDLVLKVIGAQRLTSLWARVELGDEPGVEISYGPPPPDPSDATCVHIRAVPSRSDKANPPFAELDSVTALVGDEAIGCRIVLGGDTAGIVFGFYGPIKPTIDGLWPALGGTAGRPADHRIRDLRIETDEEITGAQVSLWPIRPGLP